MLKLGETPEIHINFAETGIFLRHLLPNRPLLCQQSAYRSSCRVKFRLSGCKSLLKPLVLACQFSSVRVVVRDICIDGRYQLIDKLDFGRFRYAEGLLPDDLLYRAVVTTRNQQLENSALRRFL